MRTKTRLGFGATLVMLGTAVGWTLHCQTPRSHVTVQSGEACATCHQSEFQSATQPLHSGVLSTNCAECHSNTSWSPARGSDHSWPLEGAHATATCNTCHLGEPAIYAGTSEQCIDCHRTERDAVREPSHADFSSACQTCHGAFAWKPANFEHEWPLEGAHAATDCASCHGVPPTYAGTPTACVSCHERDRAVATEPPHDGFSTDCQTCHGTASWDFASFLHTASFPLTGVHQTTECGSCHTGTPARFAGTARECVGCHQQDYDTSPFPGHAEFPTTCQDCHTTSGWSPASGGSHPQNRFSITGRHAYACNECHNPSLGPNGAGNADCVGCHEGEHTLARMDNTHRGEVGNYPTGPNRAPNFCLQCHPGGNE